MFGDFILMHNERKIKQNEKLHVLRRSHCERSIERVVTIASDWVNSFSNTKWRLLNCTICSVELSRNIYVHAHNELRDGLSYQSLQFL